MAIENDSNHAKVHVALLNGRRDTLLTYQTGAFFSKFFNSHELRRMERLLMKIAQQIQQCIQKMK